MEGNVQSDCAYNAVLNVTNSTFKLGSDDIAKFKEISNEIEKNFSNLDIELKNKILLSLLQKLISLMIDKKRITRTAENRENYNRRIISEISLITVSTCKYVDICSNKYATFPYWSFGSHPSEKNRMLFGYLEIDSFYGFYMLKDNNYQLVCIITTQDCRKTDTEIFQLKNSYVLIETYTVITEIFNQNEIPNVEYIIAKVDDVHVIHSRNEISNIFGIKSDKTEYPNVISFKLLRKSTVCVGTKKVPELYMEVFVKFSSTGIFSKHVYLILPSKYVCLNMQMKEGSSYMLYYKTPMKIIHNPELTRIKNLKIYEIPSEHCFFQPVDDGTCEVTDPLSILKCKSHIENSKDLVTCRGVVKRKYFANSFPSRTVKISAAYGFGTPGGKIHRIELSSSYDNQMMFLDCYLNNWENMLMPLGLIPEMDVIVRHASPQSKKYLKSTIFTSFEMVSYKPSSNFSTVNLYTNEGIDWGIPNFLSQGHNVPVNNVLLWGRVFSIFMIKFSLSLQCIQCRQIINTPNNCNICGATEHEIKFEAKFNAADQFGQSSVMTKSLEVLQILLNLNENDIKDWILHIGPYSYNYFDKNTPPARDDLTNYLEKIGDQKVVLDLKCRKTTNSTQTAQRASWYCIEARRL